MRLETIATSYRNLGNYSYIATEVIPLCCIMVLQNSPLES